MVIAIPPKYAVSGSGGIHQGQSAIHLARVYGEPLEREQILSLGIEIADAGRGPRRRHHPQQMSFLNPTLLLHGTLAEDLAQMPPKFPMQRPAIAPADSDSGELSGWYLSYVYDPVRDGSDLVIIDASSFMGKPVARVQLPRRVPYGFHGNWIAG